MEPEDEEFKLENFEHTLTATVRFNGLAQLFFAANTQGWCLLVFRTSLRLMVVADPNRARQEAVELLAHADITYNIPNSGSFQRLLRSSVEQLFRDLATPSYATVRGANGGDNQWFLHNVTKRQLTGFSDIISAFPGLRWGSEAMNLDPQYVPYNGEDAYMQHLLQQLL